MRRVAYGVWEGPAHASEVEMTDAEAARHKEMGRGAGEPYDAEGGAGPMGGAPPR